MIEHVEFERDLTMPISPLNFVETASGTVPLSDVALRLHPSDDVAIAKVGLQIGTTLVFEENKFPIRVTLRQFVPAQALPGQSEFIGRRGVLRISLQRLLEAFGHPRPVAGRFRMKSMDPPDPGVRT